MNGNRNLLNWVMGIGLLLATAYSLAANNEAMLAPLIMVDLSFLLMWKFKPDGQSLSEKAAYKAILAFGFASAIFSVATSVLVPIYGDQWNLEKHLDDVILYPIINDGRENCYIAALLFVFYIGFSLYYRIKQNRLKITTT